ncbi:MAG: hypothetical protein K2L29_02675 [Duncaniella sp.]|nr:hypothetical protein [Duncaniella sp.]
MKELLGLLHSGNAPLCKQLANGRDSRIALRQPGFRFLLVGCKGTVIPFTCHLCRFFFFCVDDEERKGLGELYA